MDAPVAAAQYRKPALLAKIVAGVDQMSDGRVEFGIGAGWKAEEYRDVGRDRPIALSHWVGAELDSDAESQRQLLARIRGYERAGSIDYCSRSRASAPAR